jgi:drug/metabolite transporter (DMT)-like permease
MDEANPRAGGMVLTLFATAVTIGGANFLAVRFSNRDLEPFWGAGLRFTLAATLFVIIALVLRLPWPRGRQLGLNMVYGLFSFALFYALMYWALLQVTAGVATVVLAIVPLVTSLLAAMQRLERLSIRAFVGSLLALAGIVWTALAPGEVVLPITALLAMVAAAVCVGQGVIVSKKLSGNHPAMTNAVALSTGSLALLAFSALSGEVWVLPSQPEAVWSLVYLVTIGSVGLFILALLVVRHWTASATSYMFVLFPVVTMLLGAWLADEPVTINGAIGALLVMAGVWFGVLSPGARVMPAQVSLKPAPTSVLETG